MTGTPLLTATDLRVSYGAFHVIKGVSLSVNAGDALAIIGPNGAGKSTLFKALTGEISCRSGEVRFRGKDVTALPAHLRTAEGMGRTFQVSRVFLELTALANVIVALESRQRCKKRGQGRWWRAAPSPRWWRRRGISCRSWASLICATRWPPPSRTATASGWSLPSRSRSTR
ncbi:ATP-binding cassette domain-containing protein [Cereibacter sphaeroides]|uniref:ATP-binding cassette domain-containing protein n=1 Tax=Cereibacter sphaeroides TaxID=1063 RepID=UPI00202B5EA4|nr:ATP-binding cassette domain-containing protein [Cereibacter sphaeroides]